MVAVRSLVAPVYGENAPSLPALLAGGPHFESWTGVEGAADSLSVYGGVVAALYGDIRRDGWRVRVDGGYGVYGFNKPLQRWLDQGVSGVRYRGSSTFADVLIGYKKSWGPWTLKGYAGWIQESHTTRPDEGQIGVAGVQYDVESRETQGFKGVFETWLRLNDWGFLQTDVSWSSPQSTYSGRTRFGYRLNRSWSTGVEAALFGNREHSGGRAGGFVRLEGERGEVSLGVGLDGNGDGIGGGYGSVSALLRF